jgi:hypothetical protein
VVATWHHGLGLLVTGTKLAWNGWILLEAVGDKTDGKNDGKNDKNDGIWVKELAAACHGISVTSTPQVPWPVARAHYNQESSGWTMQSKAATTTEAAGGSNSNGNVCAVNTGIVTSHSSRFYIP